MLPEQSSDTKAKEWIVREKPPSGKSSIREDGESKHSDILTPDMSRHSQSDRGATTFRLCRSAEFVSSSSCRRRRRV